MPIVDVHAHLIPRGIAAAHEAGKEWHGLNFRSASDGSIQLCNVCHSFHWQPAYWDAIEARLEQMAIRRIDMQILSLSGPLLGYQMPLDNAIDAMREVNDEIGSIVSDYPNNFAGLAALPLQDVDRAIAELDRAVRELRLKGAIVGATVNGRTWDNPRWLPLLAMAEEIGAVLFIHPTVEGGRGLNQRYALPDLVGQPLEITMALSSFVFGGILDKFPTLKLLFAQAGGYIGYCAGRFDHGYDVREEARVPMQYPSNYLKKFYFDSLTYSTTSLRQLIDVVGPSGVLLGSDYPGPMSLPDPVSWIETCDWLNEQTQTSILGDNAVRLFKLSPST